MGENEEQMETRTDAKGQIELSIVDTPLYKSCERLVLAKARVMSVKKELEDAEVEWCEEMKAANKPKINHKGDIIQYVHGRTSDDHARFCKA